MLGQSSMMRTILRRPERTSRSGAWNRRQRSAFRRTTFQYRSQHSGENQRTRSAEHMTMVIQLALASKLVEGKRHNPESFSRSMWFSTYAWARIAVSRS